MGCGSSKVGPSVTDPWAEYSKVFEVAHKRTKQHLAMKMMRKVEGGQEKEGDKEKDADAGDLASATTYLFRNEASILGQLKHPNIVEFKESFEDAKNYYILTVLCQGGELFDRVGKGGFTEKAAARLTREMLEALAYCHSKNVVHRDLKPENFVFETKSENSPMKLIDFGCALKVAEDTVVDDVTGSPYYVAPEVFRQDLKRTGKTWKASDMWSIGVMIFLLTHGYPPFNGSTKNKIFKRIKRGKYQFARDINLSEGVKDIIRKLLVMDPAHRLTARQALRHEWVTGSAASDEMLPMSVIQNLTEFRAQCRLKKAVANVMRQRMSDVDKDVLDDLFNRFDKNGDGALTADEIAEMLAFIGKAPEEADELMREMDEDHDGVVSRREFANMAVMAKMGRSVNDIRAAWQLFDKDGDGFVTVDEVEQILGIGSDGAKQLIAEVDKNSDGKISFEEWLVAMKQADVMQLTGKIVHDDDDKKDDEKEAHP